MLNKCKLDQKTKFKLSILIIERDFLITLVADQGLCCVSTHHFVDGNGNQISIISHTIYILYRYDVDLFMNLRDRSSKSQYCCW